MTISDGLMIAAVVLGPLIAVQVQKYLESLSEKRNRKLEIFKSLMATRATRLDPVHVQALNRMDIEFPKSEKKNKAIVDSWKIYLDHLNSYSTRVNYQDQDNKLKEEQWQREAEDHFAELLCQMGKILGFEFDKVHIKKATYRPRGHDFFQLEQDLIRFNLVRILRGEQSFPIKVTEVIQEGEERLPRIESPK